MPAEPNPDPLRMYIVVRRGAVDSIARGGELAGAAAVRCLHLYAEDERFAEAIAAWRPRPGKVVLRARGGQWDRVLEEPHAMGGDGVIALPPRRRSERGPVLEQMQAMTSELEPPPSEAQPEPEPGKDPPALTYLLNPRLEMSSGKTLAQIAHAAVMASESGPVTPAQVLRPRQPEFDRLCEARDGLAAKVVDAGLTEVEPGTVTVLARAGS
jgi:peptidyl-tRNA hydrolase